jgi:hypothetical protein
MMSSGMLPRVELVRTEVSKQRTRRLLVTSDDGSSSPILVALIMEAIYSPETSVLTSATRYNITENGILDNNLCQ